MCDVTEPNEPKPLGERLDSQTGKVWAVAFSPDGQLLAAVGRSPAVGSEIMVRDVATGRLRTTFAGAGAVAFAPDGRTVAFGGEDGVVLRDLDTGRQRLALGARPDALAFAPDGLTLAAAGGSEGGVALWQVATGQELFPLKFFYPVRSLAFAPDGLTLAVGSGDRDENEGAVLLRAGTESRAGARIP